MLMKKYFLDILFGSDRRTADKIPSFHMGLGPKHLLFTNTGGLPNFVPGHGNSSHPAGMTGGDKWRMKSSLHFLLWPFSKSEGPLV